MAVKREGWRKVDKYQEEFVRGEPGTVQMPASPDGMAAEKAHVKLGYRFLKRLFDIICSAVAIGLLSPVFLIIAVLVKREDGGPAIYSQKRAGYKGRTFSIFKFRSMCVDADKQLEKLQARNERDGPVFKIADDPRVTHIGAFLRKSCLDELPQLVNILRGEMSFVGPRPALVSEVEQYTAHQRARLAAKPGLTCIWQVTKGSETTFDEWVEMDLEYIRKQNLLLDIKLVLQTMHVVLHMDGAK